jgi:glycosyltransferase involved in cell wall biosynthesis
MPLLAVGLGLLIVSTAPDVVRPIQDFIGLGDQPVGRILTVVLVSVGVAYAVIFYLLLKTERQTQRVRRLIRALSAAQVEQNQSGDRAGGILVIIPAYNESESLPAVLAEVPPTVAGLTTRVLVVDDASRDATRRVATAHGAHVVSHPVNGGQGAALQTGYLIAERLGVDVVVTLDADGQHVPAEMERLVLPIVHEEADFVVGSRRTGSYEREAGTDSAARNLGIGVFTRMINVLGGTNMTDVANGYRAIRSSRLAEIVFTEDQFHNPELLMGAARAGLRMREVPVTIRVRSAGKSKKGGTLRYGYGFLRAIVRTWLR